MTDAIRVKGLTKTFRDVDGRTITAVDGIDLVIKSGEIVAFLGPNGAGKTTSIDMMLGFITPDSGTVEVFGQKPRAAIEAGLVSGVLQSGGLLGDLTVRETMAVIASTYKNPVDIDATLERVGIASLARRKVSKCSGGEQQRLRFAMALTGNPHLLVLDEPTTGMDVKGRRTFWHQMRDEASQGRSLVFATHYLHEAEEFAERVVLLDRGRIIADGPIEEIRAKVSTHKVAATIPAARVVEAADRLRGEPGVVTVGVDADRISVATNDSDSIARLVLNTFDGSNLEVVLGTLDDAFIALTDEADGAGADGSTVSDRPGGATVG